MNVNDAIERLNELNTLHKRLKEEQGKINSGVPTVTLSEKEIETCMECVRRSIDAVGELPIHFGPVVADY